MNLSVIIPTLNEAAELERSVALVRSRLVNGPVEIIVADCGSEDETIAIAERVELPVIAEPSLNTRARACNAGARRATGETLLFLHADSQVPQRFDQLIEAAMSCEEVVGGAFEFKLNGPELRLRLVEMINRLRYRVRHVYYGDQGIFVRRRIFEACGGFPDIPLMEDAALCHKLRRNGEMQLIHTAMLTSPRRFYNSGILRALAFDILIWGWTFVKLDPSVFADRYRRDNRRRGKGFADYSKPSQSKEWVTGGSHRPS